jgi:hypothetical protein
MQSSDGFNQLLSSCPLTLCQPRTYFSQTDRWRGLTASPQYSWKRFSRMLEIKEKSEQMITVSLLASLWRLCLCRASTAVCSLTRRRLTTAIYAAQAGQLIHMVVTQSQSVV